MWPRTAPPPMANSCKTTSIATPRSSRSFICRSNRSATTEGLASGADLNLRKPQPDQPFKRGMIGQKLRRRSTMYNTAAFEHDHGLGQRQGDFHMLLDQNERIGPFSDHVPERRRELFHHDRGKAFERLV